MPLSRERERKRENKLHSIKLRLRNNCVYAQVITRTSSSKYIGISNHFDQQMLQDPIVCRL